ncbi:hypothetical protein [Mucilaginibacter sp. L196]|uniref:hypothetical protein n=1 Tax=Mucilaginibacter sp. L196 TaxID=1641870 RepID=UPI001C2067B3|nr:hypothetical protein [Mucilaginibacter sp. L196]
MTRSNLFITLSDGKILNCVVESSSAPEQGYFIENFLLPLLNRNNAESQLKLIEEHCTLNELRVNATYRYYINLTNGKVKFYEENYNYKTDKFYLGKNLTDRLITYLKIESEIEKIIKPRFSSYSNKALVARINSLPDFKWDDEGVELNRRWRVSNFEFDFEMRKNTLVIIKDNQ